MSEYDAYERAREEAAAHINTLVITREREDHHDPDDKLFFEFCDKGVAAIRALPNPYPKPVSASGTITTSTNNATITRCVGDHLDAMPISTGTPHD